jgi:hypothetical protein
MTSILIVRDGPDATSELIEAAAAADGHEVTVLDLRSARLAVLVGTDGPDVVIDGRVHRPGFVVHAASTNSLGFASPALLRRQSSARWSVRAAAAREEQGLILAAIELFRRRGAIVVNGPEVCDLALMPNAVIERLHSLGVLAHRRADVVPIEVLIAGGRVIAHRGGDLGDAIESIAHVVARAAGFQVGSVSVGFLSGRHVVVGWNHTVDLLEWPRHDELALDIVRSLFGSGGGKGVGTSAPLFVEELGNPSDR